MKLLFRISLLLFVLGVCVPPNVYGQSKSTKADGTNSTTKANDGEKLKQTTNAYVRAIEEYIKAVTEQGIATQPDTLFIGRNMEMPEVLQLPKLINGVNVFLITNEEGKKKLSYRSSLVYLNVVGWIDPEKAEFIIVRFHEFRPQHNCNIHFTISPEGKIIEPVDLKFEYPYPKARGGQK